MVSSDTKAESDNAWGSSLICFKLFLLLSGYKTKRSLEKNKWQPSLTCIKQILKSVTACPEQTRHQLKQENSAPVLSVCQVHLTPLCCPAQGWQNSRTTSSVLGAAPSPTTLGSCSGPDREMQLKLAAPESGAQKLGGVLSLLSQVGQKWLKLKRYLHP